MSCCGEKRAALKAGWASNRAQESLNASPPPTVSARGADETNGVVLRYVGRGAIALRGPHAGPVYYFAEAGSATVVRENDVEALLRTQLFTREDR
jgi:hypothetical protein